MQVVRANFWQAEAPRLLAALHAPPNAYRIVLQDLDAALSTGDVAAHPQGLEALARLYSRLLLQRAQLLALAEGVKGCCAHEPHRHVPPELQEQAVQAAQNMLRQLDHARRQLRARGCVAAAAGDLQQGHPSSSFTGALVAAWRQLPQANSLKKIPDVQVPAYQPSSGDRCLAGGESPTGRVQLFTGANRDRAASLEGTMLRAELGGGRSGRMSATQCTHFL